MPSKINAELSKITGDLSIKDKKIGSNLADINIRINNLVKNINNLDNNLSAKIKSSYKINISKFDSIKSFIHNQILSLQTSLNINTTNINTNTTKLNKIDDNLQLLSIRLGVT